LVHATLRLALASAVQEQKRKVFRRGKVDLKSNCVEFFHKVALVAVGVESVKIVAAQPSVRAVLFENPMDHSQQAVSDGDNGPFLASAYRQPTELR
jgi:hypothetical protein